MKLKYFPLYLNFILFFRYFEIIILENMESCDVSLSHPVEYIDTICLDKNVILTDGCGTATLTTENGEALPVTFIVSQQILDNSNESVKEIIAANEADIIPEAPSESLDSETANGNFFLTSIFKKV